MQCMVTHTPCISPLHVWWLHAINYWLRIGHVVASMWPCYIFLPSLVQIRICTNIKTTAVHHRRCVRGVKGPLVVCIYLLKISPSLVSSMVALRIEKRKLSDCGRGHQNRGKISQRKSKLHRTTIQKQYLARNKQSIHCYCMWHTILLSLVADWSSTHYKKISFNMFWFGDFQSASWNPKWVDCDKCTLHKFSSTRVWIAFVPSNKCATSTYWQPFYYNN